MTHLALRAPVRLTAAPRGEPFSFLRRRLTPRSVLMAIDGSSLALSAAGYVERVYAIDVSGRFLYNMLVPCNVRLVLCDGVRIPVPESAVDIAWGGDFMQHLHADEVREHLKSVRRSLAPGGEYIFVSRKNVRERLLEAGFTSVACWLGAARIPWALAPGNLPLRICATR